MMNNYTEKGQTKSLGNGRCTDEKKDQRPDDILVGHLISFFYLRNNQMCCFRVLFFTGSKALDVKKVD